MNQVVQLLTKLANDASILSSNDISDLMNTISLTEEQRSAIEAKDLDTLKETIHDLPTIKCVPIIPAEDDEESEEETKNDDSIQSESLIAANL